MPAGKPTLIVIAGPTAVGKTGAAIRLAQSLGTEIVSADSRQCYTGMHIGTAQPSAAELALVPHHFVNCFPPERSLSAADYEKLALSYLDTIFQKNDYAIACGGTGLYIKALCEGLDDMPPVAPDIEAQLNQNYAREGMDWLQQKIAEADPVFYASSGETANPSRMLRALAFRLSTGESITSYQTGIKKERPFGIIKVGLELPRAELYDRINTRVDQMIQEGLLQEAEQLFPLRHLKNLNTVGYSELFDYFEGKLSLAQAIDKIKQHSRNYAKRQLTWFKKDKAFHWLPANAPDLHQKIADIMR
ncbi:MAG TPA: tRNA (adenosine(37)-N6)-dimethylallyltransferase MiaA [Chitinophagaceae bacterium]|nr:tRNA (adenosine(37)-N6)-dimethylallyltransferase MiaA [Chitinophagaceae bacterium]